MSQNDKNKQPKPVEKKNYKTKYLDKDYIIETIYNNNTPKFALLNGNGLEIKSEIKLSKDLTIYPYPDKFGNIEKAIFLPTNFEDYKSTEHLINDIKEFLSLYIYVPEFWLNITAHYALMTWIYDVFSAIPYLEFLGDKDSGKTRIGECVAQCCYNSMFLNGASSVAAMFRLIDRYKGTLLIDEADYKDSEFDSTIAKVINVGYRKNGCIWRTEGTEYEARAFDVFCPKIITHRDKFNDDATRSRCITYLVPKEYNLPSHIPFQLPPELTKKAIHIRNKCLKWRFDNVRIFKPDLSLGIGLENRTREIAIPLLNLIDNKQFYDELVNFLSTQSNKSKVDSDTSVCVQAIKSLMSNSSKFIYIKTIAEAMSDIYADFSNPIEVSPKVAGLTVSLLGIEAKRMNNGYRINLTEKNKERLEKVFQDYLNSEDIHDEP